MRVRRPLPLGLFVVAIAAWCSACTEKKPNLEVISDRVEAESAQQRKVEEASLSVLPAPPPAPSGIDPDLWADLHWLPPSIAGVNGNQPGTTPFIAQWAFSSPGGDDPSCKALERGLAGGYGIEWDQPPQSFIFYGQADFDQLERCAMAILSGLGGVARLEGQQLALSVAGEKAVLKFARRPDEMMVLADDGRLGEHERVRPGALAENEALIELLRGVSPSSYAWSASTRDMTQNPLGVPSLGYSMLVDGPSKPWTFRFSFADESDAAKAHEASGPFIAEAEAFVEVSLHADVRLDGRTLEVSLGLSEYFTRIAADPEKAEAINAKLEALATDRSAG